MAKLIRAYRSASYGPPNVTDKYTPLSNIDFAETDEKYCDSILTRRWEVLSATGLLPQPLGLVLPSWEDAIESEAGKKPPLVVISTNRSNWIKKGIEAGNVQLGKLKITEFANASDLRALTASARQTLSPPMYAPSRIGSAGPRNVYVVVHAAEYETYKTNLAETGITVVGWQFQSPRAGAVPLCGFGASRFAAIEFCKKLRTEAEEPWDYAWLLDDNVVAFTSFAGYGKVEAVMAAGKKKPSPQTGTEPYICAGFKGGSTTISASENATWATREVKAGEREADRGKEYATLPAPASTGLIQQAALWNIAELTERKLNFGPIFVSSGEDVSLGNYFDASAVKIAYLFYEGIGIRKEEPGNDDGEPAAAVKRGREKLTALMADVERSDGRPYLEPPPPIMIKPLLRPPKEEPVRDDAEQTLARFIETSVLPHASDLIKVKATDTAVKNTASCQATEQTICRAIKLGHVSKTVLDQTFKVNGDND